MRVPAGTKWSRPLVPWRLVCRLRVRSHGGRSDGGGSPDTRARPRCSNGPRGRPRRPRGGEGKQRMVSMVLVRLRHHLLGPVRSPVCGGQRSARSSCGPRTCLGGAPVGALRSLCAGWVNVWVPVLSGNRKTCNQVRMLDSLCSSNISHLPICWSVLVDYRLVTGIWGMSSSSLSTLRQSECALRVEDSYASTLVYCIVW